MAGTHTGTVKFYQPGKLWGFITRDSGKGIYVHETGSQALGSRILIEGETVTFEIGPDPDGRDQAINVQVPARRTAPIKRGIVKRFNRVKDYGVIAPESPGKEDVLFSERTVVCNARIKASCLANARVEYRATQGPTCMEAFIVTGPNGSPLDLPPQPI